MSEQFDAVVVGGGFYGVRIALFLRTQVGLGRVAVLEQEPTIMGRASLVNQARVHNGYHYPRSILTGYRSRVNHPRFLDEYSDAIVDDFEHFYAIARRLTKTNAQQFELFCRRIGAPFEKAPAAVEGLFSKSMIERVYRVREPAFDAQRLKDILLERVDSAGGISVITACRVERVQPAVDRVLTVHTDVGPFRAPRVVNATYSGTNAVNAASGFPAVSLQHELTEMALVDLPPPLKHRAITVMDGPFFSLMPYPTRGLHTLSHVRFTPFRRWVDGDGEAADPYQLLAEPRQSTFTRMAADVARYMPGLRHLDQRGSIYEVKTVLTRSDSDDSRPILFRPDHGAKGYTCVLGGKLDNIYDVLQELKLLYARN